MLPDLISDAQTTEEQFLRHLFVRDRQPNPQSSARFRRGGRSESGRVRFWLRCSSIIRKTARFCRLRILIRRSENGAVFPSQYLAAVDQIAPSEAWERGMRCKEAL